MTKIKSCVVAGIIMLLLGGMIWAFWNYAIWTYYVVIQILGLYGFACFGVHLARWLALPSVDPRHVRAGEEDEDDAAIWEKAGAAYRSQTEQRKDTSFAGRGPAPSTPLSVGYADISPRRGESSPQGEGI